MRNGVPRASLRHATILLIVANRCSRSPLRPARPRAKRARTDDSGGPSCSLRFHRHTKDDDRDLSGCLLNCFLLSASRRTTRRSNLRITHYPGSCCAACGGSRERGNPARRADRAEKDDCTEYGPGSLRMISITIVCCHSVRRNAKDSVVGIPAPADSSRPFRFRRPRAELQQMNFEQISGGSPGYLAKRAVRSSPFPTTFPPTFVMGREPFPVFFRCERAERGAHQHVGYRRLDDQPDRFQRLRNCWRHGSGRSPEKLRVIRRPSATPRTSP